MLALLPIPLAEINLLTWLSDPDMRGLVIWPLLAGAAVVLMCAVLSVLVVVKRLAFVGQGVAHSAFGGFGVAAVMAAAFGATWMGQESIFEQAVVMVFCILAALGMAGVSDRRAVQVDTGIGLFLVASMAVGALLLQAAQHIAETAGRPMYPRSWESVLFGSISTANEADAVRAWIVAAVVLTALWLVRRPLLFYVVDESSAPAFGVRVRLMRTILMTLLAITTVIAMKLTGVVLSSALLVLPGAAALKLSNRLTGVIVISSIVGVLGLLLGMFASLQWNVQAGPCIVVVLCLIFGGSLGISAIAARRS